MLNDNKHDFLTFKEVTTLLRVSRTTMYSLLRGKDRKHSKPPFMKIRGGYRFPRERFYRWAGITED